MTAIRRPLLRMFMLAFIGACPFLLFAQNIDIQSDDDKPIEERLVYTRQNTFNIGIHSQGFGAGFKLGKIKNINVTQNWEAEVITLHSMKEIKTMNLSSYNARPFVYGKLNSVVGLRFGYGQERRIFGKPYWGGIETRWTYEFGASLALVKPYYYYVLTYVPSSSGYDEMIQEETFHSGIEILGRSAITKGLDEIKLSPGAHASLGLSFDIGKSRMRAQAINIDVKGEFFPMGISLMDSERDRRFFLTFMLSYNWGSRFNKY